MFSRALVRLVAAACVALACACARAESLTIFAAASMKNALDDVAKAYESRTRERIVLSYAASSALAKHIEQGAPADVFVSADAEWMDYLDQRGLIRRDTRTAIARNRLALVAPAGSKVSLKIAPRFPLAAALGKERLALGDPDSVPAGRYAKAALRKLGVWDGVRSRLASAADVRSALLLVARGEAPLGIVYTTDAAVDSRVRVVDVFPEDSYPPIVYPAAVTSQSRSTTAEAFLRSLNEPRAREVFARYGFR